jgi:hypothetical protein
MSYMCVFTPNTPQLIGGHQLCPVGIVTRYISSIRPFLVWNWLLWIIYLALAPPTHPSSLTFNVNVNILYRLDGRKPFTNYYGLIAQADCSSWDLQLHLRVPLDLELRCRRHSATQMSLSPMWNYFFSFYAHLHNSLLIALVH